MTFFERYKDIIKTESDFTKTSIENDIITKVDIKITGHFGNTVSLDMICKRACPIPLWNSTHNIGYIIRFLIELFDKEDDNSVSFHILEGTPIRIVYDKDNKAIAIGNFMEDRFIMIEDLMRLKE